MYTYIAFECCFEQYTRGLTLMILPFGRLHVKLILDNTFQCLQRRVKKYILIAVSDKEKKNHSQVHNYVEQKFSIIEFSFCGFRVRNNFGGVQHSSVFCRAIFF